MSRFTAPSRSRPLVSITDCDMGDDRRRARRSRASFDAGRRDAGLEHACTLQTPRRAGRSRRKDRPTSRDRTRSSRLSRSAGGRSAAMMICLRASINALIVWQNSCWIDLPWRNCTSSMMSTSIPRRRSLKASDVLRLQGEHEAVHELFGGEIDHTTSFGRSPHEPPPAAGASCRGRPRRGCTSGL